MSVEELRAAVAQVAGRATLEASGGITLETLRAVGGTGVDFVSMGSLTHSAAGARPLDARGARRMNALPMAGELGAAEIAELQREVRELARGARRGDPRPQLPAAGDPGRRRLRRRLARALAAGGAHRAAPTIAFCGVHFMAETAAILSPSKTVLIPDPDAGCSLSDSITAEQLADWKAEHPGAVVVMYVNTSAAVKALTDYCCTSSNAVAVVRHIYETHGEDTEILFGPDMFLGAFVERELGRRMHVWDGECHVHAGIRPADIAAMRAAHPGAEFLVHPECGCTTSVLEYVAAGDLDLEGVHVLSTGGMQRYAEHAAPGSAAIVATEIGMLYPLRRAAPEVEFIAANAEASCRFMKMITLPKLRDALRDGVHEVPVPATSRRRAARDLADDRHRLIDGAMDSGDFASRLRGWGAPAAGCGAAEGAPAAPGGAGAG